MNGTVKFFNDSKGFGFITPDNGNDLFFHISDVENQEELKDGEAVSFDTTAGDRGEKAINVRRV